MCQKLQIHLSSLKGEFQSKHVHFLSCKLQLGKRKKKKKEPGHSRVYEIMQSFLMKNSLFNNQFATNDNKVIQVHSCWVSVVYTVTD